MLLDSYYMLDSNVWRVGSAPTIQYDYALSILSADLPDEPSSYEMVNVFTIKVRLLIIPSNI